MLNGAPPCSDPGQLSKSLGLKSIDAGELNALSSGMPCSSAAARVNTLNVDPAWQHCESPNF